MPLLVEKRYETIMYQLEKQENCAKACDLTYDHSYFNYFKEYIDLEVVQRVSARAAIRMVTVTETPAKPKYSSLEIGMIGMLFGQMSYDDRKNRYDAVSAKHPDLADLVYVVDELPVATASYYVYLAFEVRPDIVTASDFLDDDGLTAFEQMRRAVDQLSDAWTADV